MKKKDVERVLSQLEIFFEPKVKYEQYMTPSSIAADLLWDAKQKGYIDGKVIADLGCGTGILGLGALLLGAKKVYFCDIDEDALVIARENKKLLEKLLNEKFEANFICNDITKFNKKVEVVFENPPFGTKNVHADKVFLKKAMDVSPIIYTFHKFSTNNFIEKFVEQNNFHIIEVYKYKFQVKAQFNFHTSRIRDIDVGVWCIEKT